MKVLFIVSEKYFDLFEYLFKVFEGKLIVLHIFYDLYDLLPHHFVLLDWFLTLCIIVLVIALLERVDKSLEFSSLLRSNAAILSPDVSFLLEVFQ